MNSVGLKRGVRFNRLRFQLGGALLFGAFLPYIVRAAALPTADLIQPVNQAFAGSIVAIVLGVWLFRNVSTYPGVEKIAYVLPAITLSFTALLLFFLLTREDYNRTLLLSGYIISIAWLILLHSWAQRQSGLRIGILPVGQYDGLERIDGVAWVRLSAPDVVHDGLDAVAVDLRIDLPSEWDRKLADFALDGLPVYHTKHLFESLTGRVELEHLSENSFGSLAPVSAFMSAKAVIDWITALLAGIVLSPLLIAVGIAVRLTSAGPALFVQQRIGYKGVPFKVYKFRTMTCESAAEGGARDHAMTKDGDARVTRFGRFLRTTRIDELPQIINILRGEMSWIGPRPEAEILSRWYEAEIPFYRYRHIVRPGVAGWAQVCQGHVIDIGDVRSKLHYDFYYIKHYSPWIDLLIIARTVRTVLTGFGSR